MSNFELTNKIIDEKNIHIAVDDIFNSDWQSEFLPTIVGNGKFYKKQINFSEINKKCISFSKFIKMNKDVIIGILLKYETFEVAEDEISRTLDLLENLNENSKYFQREIGAVATFLPSNQPLYSYTCFAIIPSLLASEVHVKEPVCMKHFFFELLDFLQVSIFFPNIHISRKDREEFVNERAQMIINPDTNKKLPLTDVIIFTGSTRNADKLKRIFHSNSLFIANGSGNNPFVITETANIGKAVSDVVDVQLYNQGQDCSAPNSILVHSKIYENFLHKLRIELKKIKVGPYTNRGVRVGPLSKYKDLGRIQNIFIENRKWIDPHTDAAIHTQSAIVEPTIIARPLNEGANYIESFAPIFFIQRYEKDTDLSKYFENEEYEKHAMYIALYGESIYIDSLVNNPFSEGRVLHPESTILRNINSHLPGIERGTTEYGGYGKETSSVRIFGITIPKPTLPQRDIFEKLVLPSMIYENIIAASKQKTINRLLELNNLKVIQPKKNRDSKRTRVINFSSDPIVEDNSQNWISRLAQKLIDINTSKEKIILLINLIPSKFFTCDDLRNIVTAHLIQKEISLRGKEVDLVIQWKDLIAFNEKNIPCSSIPDFFEEYSNLAARIIDDCTQVLEQLSIEAKHQIQSFEYLTGNFDEVLIKSIYHRNDIADTLLKEQPKILKGKVSNYYPIDIISSFSGSLNTEILEFDASNQMTYRCNDTQNIERIPLHKNKNVKLKPYLEEILFYNKNQAVVFNTLAKADSMSKMAEHISLPLCQSLNLERSPYFIHCGPINFQGIDAKSLYIKNNHVPAHRLLTIYEPALLKWVFLKKDFSKKINLSFNEEIFSQYENFDKEVEKNMKLGISNRSSLDHSSLPTKILYKNYCSNKELSSSKVSYYKNLFNSSKIPFGQIVLFGQLTEWDYERFLLLLNTLEIDFNFVMKNRFLCAKNWLIKFNRDKKIQILENRNTEIVKLLSHEQCLQIRELYNFLKNINSPLSIEILEREIYEIPKNSSLSFQENKERQKKFFANIYQLCMGENSGPRLSTFILSVDKDKILNLLNI